jgi:hypothetical protein
VGRQWKCDSTLCVGTVPVPPTHNQRNTPVTEALQVQPSPPLHPPSSLSLSGSRILNLDTESSTTTPPLPLLLAPQLLGINTTTHHLQTHQHQQQQQFSDHKHVNGDIILSSLLFSCSDSEMKPSRPLLASLQNRGCRGGLSALKVPQLWRC